MRPHRIAFVLLAIALILPASCSSGDLTEELLESQEGVGDVEIDEDSGQIEIETDDGSVVLGGGDLPDGFPISVPDGGNVQSVLQSDEGTGVSISYSSDFDEVKGFFQDWIDSNIDEVDSTIESSSPPSISWAMRDGDLIYFIRVMDAGDGTVQVALNVAGG